jgi:thiamine pyrophosphate-dependent acetolactate synthase large subunit-like protein
MQAIGRAVNTELGFPPYEKVAEGFGCRGLQVARRSELADTLHAAFTTPGTCVVNAIIDRDAGAALKHEPRARMIMFDDLASNLKNQHEFAG